MLQRNMLIFLPPDNQRWLPSYSNIASDRIHVIGNQRANVLEENLFAQFTAPRSNVIINDSIEGINILHGCR